jgi:hypothetical protein
MQRLFLHFIVCLVEKRQFFTEPALSEVLQLPKRYVREFLPAVGSSLYDAEKIVRHLVKEKLKM